MKSYFIVLVFLFPLLSIGYEQDNIRVGRCENISVLVAVSIDEQSSGLLGYESGSFHYDGMLFAIGGKGKKYFHTEGMLMPIYIIGITPGKSGVYHAGSLLYHVYPGVKRLELSEAYVLEITEEAYEFKFKDCLKVPVAVVGDREN